MRPHFTRSLPAIALSLALIGTTTTARAQGRAEAEQSYVTHTTIPMIMPEGGSGKEFHDLYKEYFDKVLAKNPYIKHFSILRHAWGNHGGTFVVVTEYASWGDIAKAEDETVKLIKAAWPDEAAGKAFFAKFRSYQDMHHSDEVYTPIADIQR